MIGLFERYVKPLFTLRTVLVIAFLVISTASAILNLQAFFSFSTVESTSKLFAAIGVALDMVKNGAIGLGIRRGFAKATLHIVFAIAFTFASIGASTIAINDGLASTTHDVTATADSLSLVEQQIENQQEYIGTLQENLKALPTEWPANREQVIGHIQEASAELDALVEERSELLASEQSSDTDQRTGQLIYDLSKRGDFTEEDIRFWFSVFIAVLMDAAILFSAWLARETENQPGKTKKRKKGRRIAGIFRKNRTTDEDDDRKRKLQYVMAAYPEEPQNQLKSLRKVEDEHDISRYQGRKIHAELKTAGFIRAKGSRSYATARKADVVDWLNQESA